MRSFLTALSFAAILAGIAAAVISWMTRAPHLGFRIVAAVLLVDQATMTLLYLRLPVEMKPIRIALRIGAIFAIVAGALVLVWAALPRAGQMEIAMPVVGGLMIAHGALTLRWLAVATPPESA